MSEPVSPSRTIGIGQTVSSPKIAFSPKDTYIATESRRGEILLWNYMTGEYLAYLKAGRARDHQNSAAVCDIVYSLDGELLYCCFMGCDILVWNTGTKETRIERYKEMIDVGAECYGRCTISSDGRFIIWVTDSCKLEGAFAPIEQKTGPLVLDRESRQIIKRFGEEYYFRAISPNGNWIALDCDLSERCIWNTRNQTQHCVIPGWSLGLALTDSYIAFTGYNTIEIWDLRAKTILTEIPYTRPIGSFFLSPDDQYLLVISATSSIYSFWSVSKGELISRFYEDRMWRCVGFSHDSRSIAWYTRTGTPDSTNRDRIPKPFNPGLPARIFPRTSASSSPKNRPTYPNFNQKSPKF